MAKEYRDKNFSQPILCGMTDAKHLHLVVDDFINTNIGPGRKHQLAGVLGQADAPDVRKFPQAGDVLINGLGNAPGGSGIIFSDVLDNMRQVVGGLGGLPNAHQD